MRTAARWFVQWRPTPRVLVGVLALRDIERKLRRGTVYRFGAGAAPEDAVTLRMESAGKLSVIRIGGIIDGTSGPVEFIGPS